MTRERFQQFIKLVPDFYSLEYKKQDLLVSFSHAGKRWHQKLGDKIMRARRTIFDDALLSEKMFDEYENRDLGILHMFDYLPKADFP